LVVRGPGQRWVNGMKDSQHAARSYAGAICHHRHANMPACTLPRCTLPPSCCSTAQLKKITAALSDGAALRVREITLPQAQAPNGAAAAEGGTAAEPLQPEQDQEQQQLVSQLVAWLGAGSPLPPADPAVVCTFVAIPGSGKSALMQGLSVTVAGRRASLTTKVRLNPGLAEGKRGAAARAADVGGVGHWLAAPVSRFPQRAAARRPEYYLLATASLHQAPPARNDSASSGAGELALGTVRL
jgi:hypothetical protein